MPFGTAVLLLRSARPIILDLQRWLDRPDGDRLRADQQEVETSLGRAHAATG